MQNNKTSAVLVINLIISILGMVLLTQFYSLFFHNTFTMAGWTEALNQLLQYNEPRSLQYKFIMLLKNTAPFSIYLFAAGIFICAFACITLLARSFVCLILAIGFFLAWALSWNDPGMWPFELSFPFITALIACLSTRKLTYKPSSIFLQLRYRFGKTLLITFLLSVALYYVTYIAFTDRIIANKIALYSSLSFLILCLIPFYVLRKRRENIILEKDEDNRVEKYLDFIIIVIGSMLVLQVNINYFSGVFEISNFQENISYFADHTNATWISPFLKLSADYSYLILPLYTVFEITLSLALTLLIVRGPILLVTAVLLGVLAFSELGVSATWPPDPANLTWQWELLLVTLVSIIIGIERTLKLKNNFTLKKLILGEPIAMYQSISLLKAFFISVIAGAILYFIALTAQAFIGDSYLKTANASGIIFTILIFILLMTNKFRK